jgi:hypothetical protein
MALQVLQRPFWDGQPIKQAELMRLTKDRDGRTRVAVLELWSHQVGWETRLLVDGEFQSSDVCRSQEAVFSLMEQLRDQFKAKGWTS